MLMAMALHNIGEGIEDYANVFLFQYGHVLNLFQGMDDHFCKKKQIKIKAVL